MKYYGAAFVEETRNLLITFVICHASNPVKYGHFLLLLSNKFF